MSEAPFFVGYLPTPPPLRATNRLFVGLLLVCFAASAITLAAFQRDPGPAAWNAEIIELQGIYRCIEGIPLLEISNAEGMNAVLLVRPGKFGMPDAYCGPPVAQPTRPGGIDLPLEGLDGQQVTVRGTILSRNSHRMMEVHSLVPSELTHAPAPQPTPTYPRASIALRAEVVDSKCYLGAMKPGTGSVHRSCAALCLAGGIPAGLVTTDSPERFFVFAHPAASTARMAGSTIEVEGDIIQIGSVGIVVPRSSPVQLPPTDYRDAR